MPPSSNPELHAAFRNTGIPNGKKARSNTSSNGQLALTLLQLPMMECRHCRNWKLAENVTKMRDHLAECSLYIQFKQEEARKKGIFVQTKLTMQKRSAIVRLNPEEVKKIDKKAGYAIYCGARPFSMFDEPNMRVFLDALQPAYTAPHQKAIGGKLLIECYNETYAEVLQNIRENTLINVSIDESSTSTRQRVINYCIIVKAGSFCMEQAAVKIGPSGAEEQAEFLEERLNMLEAKLPTNERLPMINSVATDTCTTMRSLWVKLGKKERFKHTFFVPCDSHGLQLLIKDIIEHPIWATTMTKCNYLTAHFRNANKQLALLRHYMKQEFGMTFEFVLAVKTRWGTQVKELKALKRSKDALKLFARDRKNECEDMKILDTIKDPLFWEDVDNLLDILRPIHEAQIMSESSNGNLSHVKERWDDIREYLLNHEDRTELLRIFDERVVKQTSPCHYLAWHLHPRNAKAKYTDHGTVQGAFEFLGQYYSGNDLIVIRGEYLAYKKQRGEFSTPSLWETDAMENWEIFWAIASDFCPTLAHLAERLLTTPPNSVPSERAFSALKLQHTPLRNRLSLTKLDYLCFIYMNRRVLDRKAMGYKRTIYDLTPMEELAEENEILDHEATDECGVISEDEEEMEEVEYTTKRRRLNAGDGGEEEVEGLRTLNSSAFKC
jgi:Protein of unknown function (DUF 659)/hAT family C-terminal dimerisation region